MMIMLNGTTPIRVAPRSRKPECDGDSGTSV